MHLSKADIGMHNNKPIDKEYDRSKPSGAPFARRYLQKIFDAS